METEADKIKKFEIFMNECYGDCLAQIYRDMGILMVEVDPDESFAHQAPVLLEQKAAK